MFRRLRVLLGQLVHPPVLIYQMGKVGSSSLFDTLSAAHRGYILHAHARSMLSPKLKMLLAMRRLLRLKIYVICPIREAISRNVSAYFQNLEDFFDQKALDEGVAREEMLKSFLERFNHRSSLDWFEDEFEPLFGVDVYSRPFAKQEGWATFSRGSYAVLIYRSDLAHDDQLALISDFLGKHGLAWKMANKSTEKSYGAAYRDFTQHVKLPSEYLDTLTESHYMQHFWASERITEFREPWQVERTQ